MSAGGEHTFTPRRTPEQKRHLTVSNGLLGQVIIDDDGVFAVAAELGEYTS